MTFKYDPLPPNEWGSWLPVETRLLDLRDTLAAYKDHVETARSTGDLDNVSYWGDRVKEVECEIEDLLAASFVRRFVLSLDL